MRHILRISTLIILFLLVALCAAGCARAASEKNTPLTELHVSYATRPVNVPSIVAVNKGFFEKSFAKQGISIVWHELSGPEITEALASGSIDIATSLNSLSALMAKAAGNDMTIISGFSQFPDAIALVAGQGRGMSSLADFKGKKVAVTKGTMLHEMLLKALAEENLTAADIEIYGMDSPNALTALLGGQIDAAVLPEPLLHNALSSGKAVQLRSARGLISGQTVIAARSAFLSSHPELARLFLQIHDECLTYMSAHEEEVLLMSAASIDMPLAEVQVLYPKFDFGTRLDEAEIQAMKESVAFLQANGMMAGDVLADRLVEGLVDLSYSSQRY